MVRRFVVGLSKGVLLGAVLSLLWIKGLGAPAFVGFLAYAAAVISGALTGLVAGRPLWAKGALVEALLKAVVGALVGGAALYGMRKWLNVTFDLGPLGSGKIGEIPSFALSAIAVALGIVFELDNTGAEPTDDQRARVHPNKARVEEDFPAELEEADEQRSNLGVRRKG